MIEKPVYSLECKDGKTRDFKVRPTTRNLMNKIKELEKARSEDIDALLKRIAALGTEAEMDDEMQAEYERVMDKTDYVFTIFCTITKGEHDMLDVDDFDIKVAEDAINFWT